MAFISSRSLVIRNFFPKGRFGKHGIAINLIDGPKSKEIMDEIESHFGRPIIKLDTEDVDEIEKLQN